MDDFLHNLRSGKLKQPDRSNRSYNDQQYKGGQRRPIVDRRKRDYDNKESFERLNALKDVLENLAESQKKIAEAMETRNQVEDRKATALEILAKNVLGLLSPGTSISDFSDNRTSNDDKAPKSDEAMPAEPPAEAESVKDTAAESIEKEEKSVPPPPKRAKQTNAAGSDKNAENQMKIAGKLTVIDQQTLYPMISRMREKGESWERIARHIADKGYPTVSGKGQWRGVMVKNLYEKLAS